MAVEKVYLVRVRVAGSFHGPCGEMACFVAERAEKMVADCLLRAGESLLLFKIFISLSDL